MLMSHSFDQLCGLAALMISYLCFLDSSTGDVISSGHYRVVLFSAEAEIRVVERFKLHVISFKRREVEHDGSRIERRRSLHETCLAAGQVEGRSLAVLD